MKTKIQIMIAIFVFGIACGWMLGLLHQAGQKAHKQSCPVCSQEACHDH